MAGNSNYIKGRRFEYERMKHWKELGYDVVRTAGSHGPWDLVVVDSKRGIVTLIQCKVVEDNATARRLLENHRQSPLHLPMQKVHQTLEVKVKGSKEIHSVTI